MNPQQTPLEKTVLLMSKIKKQQLETTWSPIMALLWDPLLQITQQIALIVPGAQCNQIQSPQYHLLATTAETAETERSSHFHCQHCVTIFHNQTCG